MNFKIILSLAMFLFLGAANAVTKIACIGDSITYGYDPTSTSLSGYVQKLQALLGSNYIVENDGVSSTTAIRAGAYPYWTKGKLSNVFAGKPNVITIMLGTNDSRPDFWDAAKYKKDFGALIDTLSTMSTKPKIWIMFPPPAFRDTTNRPSDSNVVKEIAILKQIASDKKLATIDQHSPLQAFTKYFKDGIHPNQAGYDTIAQVMYRAMTSVSLVNPALENNQEISARSGHFSMILSSIGALANLDSKLVPGASYSVQAFDMKGALLARSTVKNGEDMKLFAQGLQVGSRGLKVLEFNRVMQ